MKCLLRLYRCLLLASLGIAVPAQATDFTRFLAGQRLTSVEGSPHHLKDVYGNVYRLQTLSAHELASQVGLSILTEALGLPNVPTYPTLVFEKGHWVSAALQVPVKTELSFKKITPEVLGEYLGHVALGRVLNRTHLNLASVLDHQGMEHVVTLPQQQGSETNTQELESALKSLSAEQLQIVNTYVSTVISRLESLTRSDFEKALGEGASHLDEILKRKDAIRSQMKLPPAEPLFTPVILKVPPRYSRAADLPSIEVAHEIALLWAAAFLPDNERAAIPIQQLLDGAKTDSSRIDEVLPHIDARLDQEIPDPIQLTINPSLSDLMMVIPVNDPEAREISRVAKSVGVHVHELETLHGAKLDLKAVNTLIAEAKEKNFKRVVIEEIPGEPLEVEEEFKKAGLELIIIDHHAYKKFSRFNRLSSLEQAAQLLGFSLSPKSKMIAVQDRSFLHGQMDLGVPKNILDINAKKLNLKPYEMILEDKVYDTPRGKFYVIKYTDDSISSLANQLVFMNYPNPVQVITINDGDIRFSGLPENVEWLKKVIPVLIKRYAPDKKKLETYFGGDQYRSMYWGLKNAPKRLIFALMKMFERELSRKGYSLPDQAFAIGPKLKVPEVLAIPDPKARVRMLNRLFWSEIPEPDRQTLFTYAKDKPNTFEISALLGFAYESKDKRWRPQIRAWLEKFEPTQEQYWQKELVKNLKVVLEEINRHPACQVLLEKKN